MKKNYEEIIKKQEELNARIREHKHFDRIKIPFPDTNAKTIQIAGFLRCLRQELNELNDDLAFKHWKNKEPDWEHAKEEWIDCLHFFVSIFSSFPLDKEKFINLITWKEKDLNSPTYKNNKLGVVFIDILCFDIAKAMEFIFIDIESFHDEEDGNIIDKIVLTDNKLIFLLEKITLNLKELSKVIFKEESEIYEEYKRKNKINHERVDNKY